jgi:Ice-binding-like
MNRNESVTKPLTWSMALLLAALVAGCGGGLDPILGGGGAGGSGPGPAGPAPVLGAAAPFGFFSSAALTNEGNATVINGDAATTSTASSITGFHDSGGFTYTETCPAGNCGSVTGTIYASDAPVGDPAGVGVTSAAAALAALAAFNDLSPAARPGGLDVVTNSLVGAGGLPNELGGRTLAPGIYYSGAGGVADYQITTGDLTLDAQGNANAVWVFQADSTLLVSIPTGPTLTVPRTVQLINGAQAKNVFWYVPAGATINTGSNMVGTIISNASTTFSTSGATIVTTLDGRALVLVAGATMVNTVVNVPAP